jgi:2-keto-4-pentenoate hydratase/2-oxohepta-3-ene-1,7-dioic acid hydratase in catechol pathway
MMFLKPPSSVIGPEEAIVLTKYSQRVEHEGELALVIGRRCAHLRDADDSLSFVMGYTCLNDVTARDLQKSDVQFTRAKGFDTFCAVGPHIETDLDPSNVLVETHVNRARRQSGLTSLMTYPPAFLVRWISRMMTLMPGDVIATGTPAGVGPLVAGDTVEVSVAGVGVLRNPVHAPQA